MRQSDSIEELAPKWVAALNDLHRVVKDEVGHYGAYATLGNVLDTVKPVLASHDLALQQYNGPPVDGAVNIVTRIWHPSGQWIEDYGQQMPAPNDPQKVGGALSYSRRYALMTFLGLATEDDDGQAASDQIKRENEPHPLSERVAAVQTELRAMGDDDKADIKMWAHSRSLSAASMLDEETWLETVESWLDERSNVNG